MSVEILLNQDYFFLKNVAFYQDNVTINCSLECKDSNRNSIVLWAVNPRTNIDNIMYVSNLLFDIELNSENSFGTLETELFLCYHNSDIIMIPMEIMTNGRKILQFVIHFPTQDRKFLRELKLLNKERFREFCFICYEEKDNNIFVDDKHNFCFECVMKLNSNSCPICRQEIKI